MNEITQNKVKDCGKICTDHVFVFHGENEHLRISVNDIVYLKAARDYCEIHTRRNQRLMVSAPMKDVYEDLPSDNFIRINRSYIINISFISKITGNLIEMEDGGELVISRTYKETVMKKFIFIGSRKR
jgi:DNA-binding LytR/AlgR family response regulator